MALKAGDDKAESGMSLEIYKMLETVMLPDVTEQSKELKPEEMDKMVKKVKSSWKKLAFAIASGVIAGLEKMEIFGIEGECDFTNAKVTGTVQANAVTGKIEGSVSTRQKGATTGHVK